jgi:hypothetical protein
MFAQDMAISVISGGIKHEYALLIFYRDNILILFWFFVFYFWVATFFDLCMLFSLHYVRSQQIRNGAESVFISTMLFVMRSVQTW